MAQIFDLYHKLHAKRKNTRIGLFRAIKKAYGSKKALYPGAFVHLTPSLVFSKVVYVDSFKDSDVFFACDEIKEYLNENKEYRQTAKFRFHHQEFTKKIPEDDNSFDLLISQYSGLVSQDCKRYLMKGGILVADDSHGDASMAKIDEDYEFLGVYERRTDEKYVILTKNLSEYFIQNNRKLIITEEYIRELGRGIGYYKTPAGYIFRKVV